MTNRIRKCCIVLLVLFAAGCDPLDDFEAGPLGAVEIGEDEPVRIRSLFPITGAASSHGASLERAVELAVRDFGSIHGRVVDPGAPVDAMCSPDLPALPCAGQLRAGLCVLLLPLNDRVRPIPFVPAQPYLRSPSVTSSVTCSPSRSTTIFTTSPGDCSRSA